MEKEQIKAEIARLRIEAASVQKTFANQIEVLQFSCKHEEQSITSNLGAQEYKVCDICGKTL